MPPRAPKKYKVVLLMLRLGGAACVIAVSPLPGTRWDGWGSPAEHNRPGGTEGAGQRDGHGVPAHAPPDGVLELGGIGEVEPSTAVSVRDRDRRGPGDREAAAAPCPA